MNESAFSELENRSDPAAEQRLRDLEEELRKLDRQDWWLWCMAVVVMLTLTFAVFTLSFPSLLKSDDPFFQFSLNRSVRGLILLVLIFNGYTIHQQVRLKRLRRSFSLQLDDTRLLKGRVAQYHDLAIKDSLTGIYNRRFAQERLVSEVARSHRYGHPLALLAIDLDEFKQINDTYGHAAGDEVLKTFAARLHNAMRGSDLVARMGGDEFLALLPECTVDRVEPLLKRLRPLEIQFGGATVPIRFSAGWVGYEKGESLEQFLERADRTLYSEKRAAKELAKRGPALMRN